jgi:hypothetical protein
MERYKFLPANAADPRFFYEYGGGGIPLIAALASRTSLHGVHDCIGSAIGLANGPAALASYVIARSECDEAIYAKSSMYPL